MNYRQPIRSLTIGLVIGLSLLAGTARADWDPSPPGDPARQWNVNLKSTVGYDDNTYTASKNPQSSLTESIEPSILIKLPPAQTSGQLLYTYNATFYSDHHNVPDQSHVVDANLTHSFTPRLTASIADSFVHGISPALVNGIITRERGDYSYNNVGASLSYSVTPRWTLSIAQSWDRWMFETNAEAEVNNRDDFGTTVSAVYALDSRSTIGANYSYSRTSYAFSSITNSARDSDSQAVYISLSRRFNPLLAAQANLGAQLAGFGGGGGGEAAPYLSFGLTYNFGANSTLTLGANYNIQVSELAQFRSSDQLSSFVALSHHFTPKFYTTLNFNYTLAQYQNLNPIDVDHWDPTQKSNVDENSWQLTIASYYDFTPWCGAYANYTYSEVVSGFDNPITGFLRSFTRDQIAVGVKLSY